MILYPPTTVMPPARFDGVTNDKIFVKKLQEPIKSPARKTTAILEH